MNMKMVLCYPMTFKPADEASDLKHSSCVFRQHFTKTVYSDKTPAQYPLYAVTCPC